MSDHTSGADLRQRFLDYFASKQHEVVASSALVPHNDDTLLFTNAGMVQFKDVFLGADKRDYTRAASSQKCARAGGKHNDLEEVGRTARHLTYFEMLGNFSFGDYFKREAIEFSWEFIREHTNLEFDKLYVTVFRDDDEAYDLFKEICGLPDERIIRCGEKDNFWSMGETGPCGPCAEWHYDRGEQYGGPETLDPESEADRLIEFWNLVFMQFDRDATGKMTPLPSPCIDTGMGLERLAVIVNDLGSVYETDLLSGLIDTMKAISGKDGSNEADRVSLQVIADHARSVTFLLNDGVLPSNEGRGYVLRRILRRALRHGKMLEVETAFFDKVAEAVILQYRDAFPELKENHQHILNVIRNEEARFTKTLTHGMSVLEDVIAKVKAEHGDDATVLPGEEAFFLYDTFGFPLDLTKDIATDAGLTVDMKGYDKAMQEQAERARKAQAAGQVHTAAPVYRELLEQHGQTTFLGYDRHFAGVEVIALVKDGNAVQEAASGDQVEVILDQTPFYGESGGQVGDTGLLRLNDGSVRVRINDVKKPVPGLFVHKAVVEEGALTVGASGEAQVDVDRLASIKRHHTATHALHWALREVLGEHVRQAGSLVAPDRLRFDFTHFAPLSVEELSKIEFLVNEKISDNAEVTAQEMAFQDAVDAGAMALFGEKYGDVVRMVSVGEWSKELCGGIHVRRAGDLGAFMILSEESVASGVRRIEAVSGPLAVQHARRQVQTLATVGHALNTAPAEVPQRIEQLQGQVKSLEKELDRLKDKLARAATGNPMDEVKEAAGIKYVTARVDGMGGSNLRNLVDELKQKLKSGVAVVGAEENGKALVCVGVTKDLMGRIKAGDLVKRVAGMVGGGGGGRPDMAQAGGKDPEKLDEALAAVGGFIEELVG